MHSASKGWLDDPAQRGLPKHDGSLTSRPNPLSPKEQAVTRREKEDRPDLAGSGSELDNLLDQHALGELETSDWQRLAAIIRGNRPAALRYVHAIHDSETLREEAGGVAQREATLSSITSSEAHPIERSYGDHGWLLSSVLPWGLAVSALFLAGWSLSSSRLSTEPTAQITPKPTVVLSDPGPSVPLGRVTGLTPVASSDGLLRPLKVGATMGRGEVFQITRGAARLRIGGGEVLVQGPAELSAIEERTVFLRRGQIAVRHPEGITIQTPVAIASGHGAFAFSADSDDRAVVTVLSGEVRAKTAPGHRSRATAADGALTAGETLVITREGKAEINARLTNLAPEGWLLAWDETTERLHDYERLILSDEPLAYWPLYRVRRHRAVLDLTQNGFDGHAIGNWPIELSDVHASQPRGAYFDGESYVESDRKPPVDLRTGFTIESWANVAGGPEYQAIYTSRWVLASNTEYEQCFGVTLYAGDDDRWQCWTGPGEYGKNWDQLHAPEPLQRNRWTHVAASFEPDAGQEGATRAITGMLRFYIDGQAVAEASHSLSLEDFEWPARIGAAEFVPKSLTSWLFRGELRDVAVYDHVLPAKRVRIHSEQGRSAT